MIWKEVDGKLREPTMVEVADWLWNRYQCCVISRELVEGASRNLQSMVDVLSDYTKARQHILHD